ncbi:MAG: ComEC/Rec2 family competence protein [Bacteroidia bacterium]
MLRVFQLYPLLRPIVPFIGGIICGYYGAPCKIEVFAALIIISLISLIVFPFLQRKYIYLKGCDGALIIIAFFISGILLAASETYTDEQTIHELKSAEAFIAEVDSPLQEKENSYKTVLRLKMLYNSDGSQEADEKILAYFDKNSLSQKPALGDLLLIRAGISETSAPVNPYEFDYKAWLKTKGIHFRTFVSGTSVQKIRNGELSVRKAAQSTRETLLQAFRNFGMKGEAYEVVAAMLLGAADEMDPGLLSAYSSTGTMHVLSVSGMHVALIYMVLVWLTNPFRTGLRAKIFILMLQLVFVWFYAFVTGMSPSVLRSVVMLSFIIGGQLFSRKTDTLNALLASLFVILIADPLLIFDTGFQLSYCAVAGIVIVPPILNSFLKAEHFIWKRIGPLITASIAAQLVTMPLGFYYFGQFPNYFLLANLIVVPLSTCVLYFGLLTIPFLFIPATGSYFTDVLAMLTDLLNTAVRFLGQLPGSQSHTAVWTKTETLFLFIVIILLIAVFHFRKKELLYLSLVSACILALLIQVHYFDKADDQIMVIHHIKGATAISVIEKQKSLLLADSNFYMKKNARGFAVDPLFRAYNMQPEEQLLHTSFSSHSLHLIKDHETLLSGKKKVVILNHTHDSITAPSSCDYLLLSKGFRYSDTIWIDQVKPGQVVADGSLSVRLTEKMRKWCSSHQIHFASTYDKGAITIASSD